MVKVNNNRLVFIVKMMFIILFTVSLFSCSSKRNLVDNPIADAPPITFNKLIRNIDTAYSTSFDYMNIKKIDVEIDNQKKSQSFKASLKMESDKFIQISINAPLGIEVLRILLTQDSFSMINYHEKYYVSGNYDDFSKTYGIDVNYKLIEKIFTNKPLIDELLNNNIHGDGGIKSFERGIRSYTIHSESVDRILRRGHKKRERDTLQSSTVTYSNSFSDDKFKLIVNDIHDSSINSTILVVYNNFEYMNGFNFPKNLVISSRYNENSMKIDMNYSKIEFNIPVKPSFRIPAKYTKKDI